MVQHILDLPALPPRPHDGHKGTFGRVLIIAGQKGMSGAACLSGLAALRGGAGLVFLAVPESLLPFVAGYEPSYLTIPLPEDTHGRLSHQAIEALKDAVQKADAIAIGPGLGQSEDLAKLVAWLSISVPKSMVLDADALNLLAKTPELLDQFPMAETGPIPRILTPHPGEFSRLIDQPIREIERDREALAAEFAERHNIVLVLKGHRTIITDGHRLAINTTGNSGMATGGTGDVLTGLITALLAQNMPPFYAAHLAAHLHGLAGDLAGKDLTEPALIASDLPKYLPQAWKQCQG